jgi:hypothetical protein
MLLLLEIGAQDVDRHRTGTVLGLEERDGPEVLNLAPGLLLEHVARRDGGGDGVLPVGMWPDPDGKLDHLLVLEGGGGHGVQDVVQAARGCGELDDPGGADAGLNLLAEAGDHVVRLVDDHQRAVVVQEICEGEPHALAELLRIIRRPLFHRVERRNPREVGLKFLVMGVDLAVRGVGDAEGLDRADDEAGLPADVLGADVGEVLDVEDPDAAGEAGVEHAAIRVAAVVQGLDGLLLDAVARHHPHDERELGLEIGVAGDADGFSGENCLAAASRQARQTYGTSGNAASGRYAGEPSGAIRAKASAGPAARAISRKRRRAARVSRW